MLLFNDQGLADKAKHLTTTAKIPHPWNYCHDEVGYNYRMPNLNAALGCAQLSSIEYFLSSKRELADRYKQWCDSASCEWVSEPQGCKSNFWLMALKLESEKEKEEFLEYTNKSGVMTRPAWTPMHRLEMYKDAPRTDLDVTLDLSSRIVNIPSSSEPM